MIPNKTNFKFQELTPITGVKPYVIRFWETEFPDISPVTSDSGQKLYARKDVEIILKVKKLLFDEKLSIPAAREALRSVDLTHETMVNSKLTEEAATEQVLAKESVLKALDLIAEIKHKHRW